jgi:hypothetical protein
LKRQISSNTQTMEYKRVKNEDADSLIRSGWSFCPKTEWKSEVRDINKKEKDQSNEEKIYNKRDKKTQSSNEKTSKI